MYNYDYNDYGYDYSNSYSTTDWGQSYTTIDNPMVNQFYNILPIVGILSLILGLLMIISIWKIFKKAGKHGWASIVPIYNFIVLIEIAGLPLWYFILFFIPFANIYAMFKIYIEIAHKFGKTTGFGVLTVFFPIICLPILAFSKCSYEGNNSNENVGVNTLKNNVGINEAQFQNIVNNNGAEDNMNNNMGFKPEPVVPSFIPSNNISNNMQNENINTNSTVNSTEVNTLPNNINNISNNSSVMWNVNSSVNDNNVNVSNISAEAFTSVNNINPIDNNNSNMNELNYNSLNNSVNVNVEERNNNTGEPSLNTNMDNTISNITTDVVPEMQNIDNVNGLNRNMEEIVVSENQTPNVTQNYEEANNNFSKLSTSDNQMINTFVNNNIINEIDNSINNVSVNSAEQNEIPEIQSISNIPVEDNSKNNISDTMSLNELLADINIEEQK